MVPNYIRKKSIWPIIYHKINNRAWRLCCRKYTSALAGARGKAEEKRFLPDSTHFLSSQSLSGVNPISTQEKNEEHPEEPGYMEGAFLWMAVLELVLREKKKGNKSKCSDWKGETGIPPKPWAVCDLSDKRKGSRKMDSGPWWPHRSLRASLDSQDTTFSCFPPPLTISSPLT